MSSYAGSIRFLKSQTSLLSSSVMSSSMMSSPVMSTQDHLHMNFLVAGGSFAAIAAVRVIAQKIIPLRVEANPFFTATVTVIAPNTKAFWNIAAPRLLLEPELIDTQTDQLFVSLESTLREFIPIDSPHTLNIIQGKVILVDSANNEVTYLLLNNEGKNRESPDMNDFVAQTMRYECLILATGASSSSAAFKLNGSSEETKNTILKISKEIKEASSICVVGAGPVGVELAGELGFKYGKTKKITLVSGVPGTLKCMRQKASTVAIEKLKRLGVQVVLDVRAVSSHKETLGSVDTPDTPTLTPTEDDFSFDSRNTSLSHNSSVNTYQSSESSLSTPDSPIASAHGNYQAFLSTIYADPSNMPVSYPNASSKSNIFGLTHIHGTTEDLDNYPLPSHHLQQSGSKRKLRPSTFMLPPPSQKPSLPIQKKRKQRTVVSFSNGYREAYDCYIPATGNIPNTSFLPIDALDAEGYVITDPYLRMSNRN